MAITKQNLKRRIGLLMETEKKRKFLINTAYFAVIAAISVLLIKYAISMLAPFVIGFVIAYLLKSMIRFLANKTKLSWKWSAVVIVTAFYVLVGVLVSLVGVQTLSGIADLIRSIPSIYSEEIQPVFLRIVFNVEEFLMRLDPSLVSTMNNLAEDVLSSMGSMVSSLSVEAMSIITGIAYALPGLFIELVLLIVSTYFVAIDYQILKDFCFRQLNKAAQSIFLEIKEYVVGTLWVCIRSYALIMFITFVEIAIGLAILKVPHAVLISACIAIFDILPVVGTGGIMLPWALIAAVSGNFGLGLGLLILYVVITVIRNIIEPKIVGGQLGLHAIVILASMFLGVQVLGVVGLFGFPIGLSLMVHLNKRGVVKILK